VCVCACEALGFSLVWLRLKIHEHAPFEGGKGRCHFSAYLGCVFRTAARSLRHRASAERKDHSECTNISMGDGQVHPNEQDDKQKKITVHSRGESVCCSE